VIYDLNLLVAEVCVCACVLVIMSVDVRFRFRQSPLDTTPVSLACVECAGHSPSHPSVSLEFIPTPK